MSIAQRIVEAIDRMAEGKPEAALICASIAADATASKEYPQIKQAHRRYRKFINNNLALITRTAFGNTAITKSLRLNYKHPKLRPDKDGLCSFEQIMYFVVRCGLVHAAEIPDTLSFSDNAIIAVSDGRLVLPARLIYGLIVAVVASPVNAGEQSQQHYGINVDGESIGLREFWGCREDVEALVFGARNERIANQYRCYADEWAKRVIQSRNTLDLLVWAYCANEAASAVLKMLPRDNSHNATACVLARANVDAHRGGVGVVWSFVSNKIGNAGGIGINAKSHWEMAACAHGVVDFEKRKDLKPVFDAFKAELRNNDQQRRADGGVALIDALLAELHERFPIVASQLPQPSDTSGSSKATDTKSKRCSSPPMSLAQFGIALDMDYRSFKTKAEAEWDLKPENAARRLWSIDCNLINDAGIEARIFDHAAKLTAERQKKRHLRATN